MFTVNIVSLPLRCGRNKSGSFKQKTLDWQYIKYISIFLKYIVYGYFLTCERFLRIVIVLVVSSYLLSCYGLWTTCAMPLPGQDATTFSYYINFRFFYYWPTYNFPTYSFIGPQIVFFLFFENRVSQNIYMFETSGGCHAGYNMYHSFSKHILF